MRLHPQLRLLPLTNTNCQTPHLGWSPGSSRASNSCQVQVMQSFFTGQTILDEVIDSHTLFFSFSFLIFSIALLLTIVIVSALLSQAENCRYNYQIQRVKKPIAFYLGDIPSPLPYFASAAAAFALASMVFAIAGRALTRSNQELRCGKLSARSISFE